MKKGFTLIELLVVVLIICILAAIALPQYHLAVMKSKTAAVLPALRVMADAQNRHFLATGAYASNMLDLDVTHSRIDECTALRCNFSDGHIEMVAGVFIYRFGTDSTALSVIAVFNPEAYKSSVGQTVRKGQIVCYDRGVKRFQKVCESFSPTGSFVWSNGKGWLIL